MSDTVRFRRDVTWNLASVAILGISGVALNAIIGRYYGPEIFGIFSQVLAVYYVFSQMAVGGFGFSVLALVGAHGQEPHRAERIVGAAIVLTGLLAALACIICVLMSGWIGRRFESPGVTTGILWVVPGLWCFAMNKTLLFALNGLRHMRIYAIANALRYLLILVSLIFLTLLDADGLMLPLSISVGEFILFPLLCFYFWANRLIAFRQELGYWLRRHLSFGMRSFFTSFLLDANTKIDVIVLSYFLSDRIVGVYSFAAMFAMEGAYQIVYVIQANVNPILSQMKVDGRMEDAKILVRKSVLYLCPAMAVATLVGCLLFPAFANAVTGNDAFAPGWIYFAVLLSGITIASSYLPLGAILNQWGYPGRFMLFASLQVGTNIVLNIVLIPVWGGLGAAVATALAFVLSIAYLKMLVWRASGIAI